MGCRDVIAGKAAISRPRVWRRLWRDECGVVAVAVAVLLPVLIGFAGLGVEVGMWFWIQRQNQSAADAAAISAALEYAEGAATNSTAAAAAAANYNLFSTSPPNTLTVSLCYGPTNGPSCNPSSSNGAQPNAVQVVLTQPLNTTFANLVTAIWGPNINTVTITTTAIAAIWPSAVCTTAANPVPANNGTPPPNCVSLAL